MKDITKDQAEVLQSLVNQYNDNLMSDNRDLSLSIQSSFMRGRGKLYIYLNDEPGMYITKLSRLATVAYRVIYGIELYTL